MKKLSTLSFLILMTFALSGQKSVDKFITKKMKEKVGYAVSLPGWLFKSTGRIAEKIDNEEDEAKYWRLTKYVKNFRAYMIDEDGPKISQSEIKTLLTHLKERDGYEEYITVRSDGTNVNVYVSENDTHINGMVFLIKEDNNFIIARLKTKLPYAIFDELNYSLVSEL